MEYTLQVYFSQYCSCVIAHFLTQTQRNDSTQNYIKAGFGEETYPDSVSVDAAMQQLRRDIELCPKLKEQIANTGHTKRHYYNKQQLLLILEHFCITIEEFEQL